MNVDSIVTYLSNPSPETLMLILASLGVAILISIVKGAWKDYTYARKVKETITKAYERGEYEITAEQIASAVGKRGMFGDAVKDVQRVINKLEASGKFPVPPAADVGVHRAEELETVDRFRYPSEDEVIKASYKIAKKDFVEGVEYETANTIKLVGVTTEGWAFLLDETLAWLRIDGESHFDAIEKSKTTATAKDTETGACVYMEFLSEQGILLATWKNYYLPSFLDRHDAEEVAELPDVDTLPSPVAESLSLEALEAFKSAALSYTESLIRVSDLYLEKLITVEEYEKARAELYAMP